MLRIYLLRGALGPTLTSTNTKRGSVVGFQLRVSGAHPLATEEFAGFNGENP